MISIITALCDLFFYFSVIHIKIWCNTYIFKHVRVLFFIYLGLHNGKYHVHTNYSLEVQILIGVERVHATRTAVRGIDGEVESVHWKQKVAAVALPIF